MTANDGMTANVGTFWNSPLVPPRDGRVTDSAVTCRHGVTIGRISGSPWVREKGCTGTRTPTTLYSRTPRTNTETRRQVAQSYTVAPGRKRWSTVRVWYGSGSSTLRVVPATDARTFSAHPGVLR